MTHSKQPKPETTVKNPAAQTGELSDDALNQVAGAMLACTPVDQLTSAHGAGGGGGAGKTVGDGSVRTNSALIGL